ncbi:MAG: hypothetical protein C0404_03135 [Verrucomicrobia bacterium]|nr:hypothetical protein [Verrucomicrobiota bacterium]
MSLEGAVSDDILKELLRYRSALFGFIRAIVRNHHAAEELFQEVALIIVQKADKDNIRNFEAWAKEIARRQIWQYFREKRDKKEISLPTEEMVNVVCEVVEEASMAPRYLERQHQALRACMGRLSGETSEMLRQRHVGNEEYSEIAARFGKTEAAVRRAVARARLLLAECTSKRLAAQELAE